MDRRSRPFQLLEECGCAVLVYGECGLMEGASPWDEPLSRRTNLNSIDLAAYAAKLGEFSVGLSKRGIKFAYHYHLKMLVETAEKSAAFCQAHPPRRSDFFWTPAMPMRPTRITARSSGASETEWCTFI